MQLRHAHRRLRVNPLAELLGPHVVHAPAHTERIGAAIDVHHATVVGDVVRRKRIGQGPRPTVDVGVHGSAQGDIVGAGKSHGRLEALSISVGVDHVGEMQVTR